MAHRFSFIISLFSFLFLSTQAQAGLTFCNKADVAHSFAVAFKDGDGFLSKGWWNIDPGECKIVVSGDLKQRYYYFRANATGRDFTGGKYAFCTVTKAFDIIGDENCKARGYDKTLFKKLDTGKTAKDFTLNLVPAEKTSATEEPRGEPYSADAVFHECIYSDQGNFCSFHSDGAKFFIYDDGQTPQWIFSTLNGLDYGTPITVQGDLLNIYDRTAVVALREVAQRSYSPNDKVLSALSGYWYDQDDPNSQFTILGAERQNQYDGQMMGLDYLRVLDHCDEFSGDGPYLAAREEESGETYCYAIEHVGDWEMSLIYLPRGNLLRYRKLE